jgi:hypothetical protein
MPGVRRSGASSRRWLGVVLLVALAALALQGASVPHTHAGVSPGLYNQDHDLALLATLHGAAVLHGTQVALLVLAAVTSLAPPSSGALASSPRSSADSRAPPLA